MLSPIRQRVVAIPMFPIRKPIRANTSGTNKENPYAWPHLDKCFRCGQPGHISNNCPQQKVEKHPLNFIEEENRENDLEEEEHEREDKEDIYYGE